MNEIEAEERREILRNDRQQRMNEILKKGRNDRQAREEQAEDNRAQWKRALEEAVRAAGKKRGRCDGIEDPVEVETMDDEDEIEFTMRYQGTTPRLNRLLGERGERD